MIDCSTGTPLPLSAAACGLLTALSYTLNWPTRAPAAVGENVIVTEQDDPAANVSGQLLLCEKSPAVWIEVIDRGTGCAFVTWMVLLPLFVPILCEPKVSEPGVKTTGNVPFPLKLAVVGDPYALCRTVRVPEVVPKADGAKTTLIKQVAPAARVLGGIGQLFVSLKLPVAVIELMARATFSPFLRVTDFEELFPKVTLPKARLLGDKVTG
jgi:hypothetical protein